MTKSEAQCSWVAADKIGCWTDSYFNRTKAIIERYGDQTVTYGVFMRRPVVSATRLASEWLEQMARHRDQHFAIEIVYPEGHWVGAGEPLLYITGSLVALIDLETLLLQKTGACCVAAYQAFQMCQELPDVGFLAMDARHCAGSEMAEMMAYAASVGGKRAKAKSGARGFIGNATDATSHFFGNAHGFGTMPHALIGYAGSTVAAARAFHTTFPDHPLTVLVDYFGLEITDSLEVCHEFKDLAHQGQLSLRLDTLGGRYVEGLDPAASYAVLDRHAPTSIRGYRTERELQHLLGTGVSAAALWYLRETLDKHGFHAVQIVASSGFGPEKCRVMAMAKAPINVIGTGSFLPASWHETYATADIIEYGGKPLVKKGREFLLRAAASSAPKHEDSGSAAS
ncbi:MAG: nicotinate phosphoribosyltransferase [Pseudomonadota bacterium]